jgi:hypothetical protein
MLKKQNRIFIIIVFIAMLLILYFSKIKPGQPVDNLKIGDSGQYGITFSTKYAKQLGLNWQETYLKILDDLEVKKIRIPIYWDEIETERDNFDFEYYDFIFKEGEKRNVEFIASIGWRLPRWPECHAPDWAMQQKLGETQRRVLVMLEAVVNRYRNQQSIKVWQLENEPFFDAFGICPPSDEKFFKQELDLVKSLDDRPILISATGELSWWKKEAKHADIFGTTLYRIVWGPLTGYAKYPLPPWFYQLKASLVKINPDKRIIIELQAEPWVPKGSIVHLSTKEAEKSFNLNQFKENIKFAQKTKFKEIYFWGAEWWYFKNLNGDNKYWNFARKIFNN